VHAHPLTPPPPQTLSGAAVLYQQKLKPSIVRRCLKAR
jgi:hypothetical protein